MDKGQMVVSSVELVIANDRQMRRDVLVASLGEMGPTCMQNCIDNIAELKTVASQVEDIRQWTLATFEDLKRAGAILFDAKDSKDVPDPVI
jgi:hypothetical protein